MESNVEWIVAAVVLPCLAGLFKKEITNTYQSWCIYKNRPFDIDRNPKTGDICKVLNTATGKWELAIIHKYSFWRTKPADRGVSFSHVTESGTLLERHVNFIEWEKIPKSKVEKKMNPADLELLKKYNINPRNV